jgi:hypothetical protein
VKKPFNFLVALLLVVGAVAIETRAQNAPAQTEVIARHEVVARHVSANNATEIAARTAAMQTVVSSLSSLPEADTLVFVNPQRILNEVLPKLMPPNEIEKMRQGFEEAKSKAGVDPTKIDYIVIATRFKKPTADLNFQAPEFMMVASGDFSAEALIGLARMATQGKLRDEKYADKTMGLMTIDPVAKQAEKYPLLRGFSEVGIVSLNGNTIATGTPAYLRAAIDAGAGKDRINPETLNSLVRDPNAIISVAGRPLYSFAKSFGMLGTEGADRASRCETNLGDFYAALTMDATNFMIRGVSNADNPDTAKILANLYSGLLRYATSSIPDATAQSVLKGLAVTAEGNEVKLSADFPQQMVVEMIQQKMKPKRDEATTSQPGDKPVVKKKTTKRRGRRH